MDVRPPSFSVFSSPFLATSFRLPFRTLVNKEEKEKVRLAWVHRRSLFFFLPSFPPARPVFSSDNVEMLNHTTTATTVTTTTLPVSSHQRSLVSLCAVILSSRAHQYAMPELHEPVYFSFSAGQGDVWGLTTAMLMCMLMSLKYQTSFFQFHVCFIYLVSKNSGSNSGSLSFTPTFCLHYQVQCVDAV